MWHSGGCYHPGRTAVEAERARLRAVIMHKSRALGDVETEFLKGAAVAYSTVLALLTREGGEQ
jgi:hypothetical protein